MKKQFMTTSSTLGTVANLIEIMKLETIRCSPMEIFLLLKKGTLILMATGFNLNEINMTGHAVSSGKIIFLKIVKKFGRFVESLYFCIVKLKGK